MAVPIATHSGTLKIGNLEIPCAVLEDGTRLLTQKGVFQAIGRTGQSSGRFSSSGDRGLSLPVFLRAQNLKSFITDELLEASAPIKFKIRTPVGHLNDALGFRAEILPLTCQVFLEALNAGVLSNRQAHIAEKCRSIGKGFAIVGITALIDEATGYQEIRDRLALQQILDKYLRKEYRHGPSGFLTSSINKSSDCADGSGAG